MTKIQVPDHVAKSIEADLKKQNKTIDTPTENGGPESKQENPAYVKESARVLDPTLLEKSFLDRMPQPTGWRMLILPYAGKAVTDGGIHLVQSTVDRESLATVVGYVVKMGPDCYKDANKFYREGAEIFNNKLFTKIIENDPDVVYKSIVAAGDRPVLPVCTPALYAIIPW